MILGRKIRMAFMPAALQFSVKENGRKLFRSCYKSSQMRLDAARMVESKETENAACNLCAALIDS